MSKAPRIEIDDLMSAVDKRDKTFYDRLSPQLQKTFAPPVALRFTSCVQGPLAEQYLIATNELVNTNYWELYEYPDLQYRLLSLVGSGKWQQHRWLPMTKQTASMSAIVAFFQRIQPLANDEEINMLIKRQSLVSFTELVNQSGLSPDEAKEIINAFKKTQPTG